MKPNERRAGQAGPPYTAEEGMAWVRVADLRAIRAEVAAIRRLLAEQQATPKPFLSEREAQAYLGCKTTWLWEQRRCGRLTAHKVGNKVYYRRDDLDALIDQSREA